MQWRKPADMRYTELCIFIDQNIAKIVNPGENPELENKIYNYLWLLVKALAIKKNMFKNFQDYDPYAFYAANRLFFALRKNLVNQGKTIKGKIIKPIKSCLNYTKALLYPMKIEYQIEAYREIIDEEFVSKKFDSFSMKEKMLEDARCYQVRDNLAEGYLIDTLHDCGNILDTVLQKLPFKKASLEYKRDLIEDYGSSIIQANEDINSLAKEFIESQNKLAEAVLDNINKILVNTFPAFLALIIAVTDIFKKLKK